MPLQLAFAGSAVTLPPVTDADGRLGLCDVLPGAVPGTAGLSWAQLAYNAGARINRWEFRWDRIEPASDVWDFSADDAAVQSSQAAGLDLLGILIGTPKWAAAPGQRPGNGVPSGLSLNFTDPKNLWATYVRATVTNYKGEVKYWEIWNEPDLSYFWTGGPDLYFRLLKVAYLTITSVDPLARVLVGGMVVPDLAFFTRVLDDATKDPGATSNGGYLDAVAWHAYGPVTTLYSNILHMKAILAARGYGDTPVWVTEDGFPTSNPNGETRQAAYVLQTISYALAAGAARVVVYRASDDKDPKDWGLVTATGVPRMGYVALQVAAHYFTHLDSIVYAPDASLERFTLYRGNQRITLLWSRSLTPLTVPLTAAGAGGKLVDWQGITSPITADGGQYQVTVPGATYNLGIDPQSGVVGGPPLMLVEDNTAPSNLSSQLYLPPMTGSQRTLALLNRGSTPATIQVTAAANPVERQVFQLAPNTTKAVDLDLLSGSAYTGSYQLSYSGALAATGLSTETITRAISPAGTWFVPVAPQALSMTNTSAAPIRATVTAYGVKGIVRARQQLQLPPHLSQTWSLPVAVQTMRLALTVQSSGPVALSDAGSAAFSSVTQAQSSWYAVLPSGRRLSLFNPSPGAVSRIHIQFVGVRRRRSMQRWLAPHHVFVLPPRAATAVVVSATSPVIAGYAGDGGLVPPLATTPSARTAFAAGGSLRRVAVLNPSHQPAHVTVSLQPGQGKTVRTAVVRPMHVSTFLLGPATAEGVVVNSDVPVVAGPTS